MDFTMDMVRIEILFWTIISLFFHLQMYSLHLKAHNSAVTKRNMRVNSKMANKMEKVRTEK